MTGLKPSAEFVDEIWSTNEGIGVAGQEVSWINVETNSFEKG